MINCRLARPSRPGRHEPSHTQDQRRHRAQNPASARTQRPLLRIRKSVASDERAKRHQFEFAGVGVSNLDVVEERPGRVVEDSHEGSTDETRVLGVNSTNPSRHGGRQREGGAAVRILGPHASPGVGLRGTATPSYGSAGERSAVVSLARAQLPGMRRPVRLVCNRAEFKRNDCCYSSKAALRRYELLGYAPPWSGDSRRRSTRASAQRHGAARR